MTPPGTGCTAEHPHGHTAGPAHGHGRPRHRLLLLLLCRGHAEKTLQTARRTARGVAVGGPPAPLTSAKLERVDPLLTLRERGGAGTVFYQVLCAPTTGLPCSPDSPCPEHKAHHLRFPLALGFLGFPQGGWVSSPR